MRFTAEELKEIAKDVDRHNKLYNFPTTPKRKKNKKKKDDK